MQGGLHFCNMAGCNDHTTNNLHGLQTVSCWVLQADPEQRLPRLETVWQTFSVSETALRVKQQCMDIPRLAWQLQHS